MTAPRALRAGYWLTVVAEGPVAKANVSFSVTTYCGKAPNNRLKPNGRLTKGGGEAAWSGRPGHTMLNSPAGLTNGGVSSSRIVTMELLRAPSVTSPVAFVSVSRIVLLLCCKELSPIGMVNVLNVSPAAKVSV